jgi:hypothetical protein
MADIGSSDVEGYRGHVDALRRAIREAGQFRAGVCRFTGITSSIETVVTGPSPREAEGSHRPFAPDRGANQMSALIRIVVHAAVLQEAIVPDDQSVRLPADSALIL